MTFPVQPLSRKINTQNGSCLLCCCTPQCMQMQRKTIVCIFELWKGKWRLNSTENKNVHTDGVDKPAVNILQYKQLIIMLKYLQLRYFYQVLNARFYGNNAYYINTKEFSLFIHEFSKVD